MQNTTKNKRDISFVALEILHPYEGNAKKHSEKQISLLAKGIEKFGFNQTIVIDKNKEIVAGHGRYFAAQKLGLKEVPCIDVSDLTDHEVRAYRLADNRINEMTEFDMGLAIEELRSLDTEGFDIELTGFDKDLLVMPDEKDDVVPDNAPTRAKLGDLWALGEHRLLCGDSTDSDAVSRLMDGKKADMVFTDPPYGVDYEGKTKEKLKIKNDITTDVFAAVLPNFVEATKKGASYYVCCPPGNKFKDFFLPFEEYYHLSATIIWAKNSLVLGHGDYHYQHEPILYGWSKGATHSYYGGRSQTTIWNIDRPTASKMHPTMKPIELVSRAILNNSKEDDIILDLFLGSGSTLIAAEKTGRTCYGMELDPKYVDVILKRWEDYTSKAAKKL